MNSKRIRLASDESRTKREHARKSSHIDVAAGALSSPRDVHNMAPGPYTILVRTNIS